MTIEEVKGAIERLTRKIENQKVIVFSSVTHAYHPRDAADLELHVDGLSGLINERHGLLHHLHELERAVLA